MKDIKQMKTLEEFVEEAGFSTLELRYALEEMRKTHNQSNKAQVDAV